MTRPVKVGDEVTQAGWDGSVHKVTKVEGNAVWIEHRGKQYSYNYKVANFIVVKNASTKKRPHGKQEYKGNGKHEWEVVTLHTQRLRVPGGWLYGTFSLGGAIEQTTFVPVPEAVGYAV